jgi:hypothetical protein
MGRNLSNKIIGIVYYGHSNGPEHINLTFQKTLIDTGIFCLKIKVLIFTSVLLLGLISSSK